MFAVRFYWPSAHAFIDQGVSFIGEFSGVAKSKGHLSKDEKSISGDLLISPRRLTVIFGPEKL